MNAPGELIIREPILLDLACGKPCMARVPGVCSYDSSTVVWAHSNLQRHGKGRSHKAHDIFGCFACRACHDWLDGYDDPRFRGILGRTDVMQIAIERTWVYLWQEGLIGLL